MLCPLAPGARPPARIADIQASLSPGVNDALHLLGRQLPAGWADAIGGFSFTCLPMQLHAVRAGRGRGGAGAGRGGGRAGTGTGRGGPGLLMQHPAALGSTAWPGSLAAKEAHPKAGALRAVPRRPPWP